MNNNPTKNEKCNLNAVMLVELYSGTFIISKGFRSASFSIFNATVVIMW